MMTMKGGKLALLLLLVVALEILFFTASDADALWGKRRRRGRRRYACRSSRPIFRKWANRWQQNFNFRCPSGCGIRKWISKYRSCQGDRIYHFKCRNSRFSLRRCSSFNYVNGYRRRLAFKCPRNQVITKVASIFNYRYKDRRFSFRCCGGHRVFTSNCRYTSKQNRWKGTLRYRAPRGYYFAGAYSKYNRIKKDRTWRFKICKLRKLVCRWRYG
ncbi:dermatopontin-like isoform X1 [Acropora millepora]|uniref:dermatopontin-like isoform X1 n=2 Tax=Acropora millepora TaxID=45264 RepID=UPI001CF103DA|nr:dermatopontin-like isoform X1 [Acropora millepora]